MAEGQSWAAAAAEHRSSSPAKHDIAHLGQHFADPEGVSEFDFRPINDMDDDFRDMLENGATWDSDNRQHAQFCSMTGANRPQLGTTRGDTPSKTPDSESSAGEGTSDSGVSVATDLTQPSLFDHLAPLLLPPTIDDELGLGDVFPGPLHLHFDSRTYETVADEDGEDSRTAPDSAIIIDTSSPPLEASQSLQSGPKPIIIPTTASSSASQQQQAPHQAQAGQQAQQQQKGQESQSEDEQQQEQEDKEQAAFLRDWERKMARAAHLWRRRCRHTEERQAAWRWDHDFYVCERGLMGVWKEWEDAELRRDPTFGLPACRWHRLRIKAPPPQQQQQQLCTGTEKKLDGLTSEGGRGGPGGSASDGQEEGGTVPTVLPVPVLKLTDPEGQEWLLDDLFYYGDEHQDSEEDDE